MTCKPGAAVGDAGRGGAQARGSRIQQRQLTHRPPAPPCSASLLRSPHRRASATGSSDIVGCLHGQNHAAAVCTASRHGQAVGQHAAGSRGLALQPAQAAQPVGCVARQLTAQQAQLGWLKGPENRAQKQSQAAGQVSPDLRCAAPDWRGAAGGTRQQGQVLRLMHTGIGCPGGSCRRAARATPASRWALSMRKRAGRDESRSTIAACSCTAAAWCSRVQASVAGGGWEPGSVNAPFMQRMPAAHLAKENGSPLQRASVGTSCAAAMRPAAPWRRALLATPLQQTPAPVPGSARHCCPPPRCRSWQMDLQAGSTPCQTRRHPSRCKGGGQRGHN